MGLIGYGYHDCKCTVVHYEDSKVTYDYCLICRAQYFCVAAWDAAKNGNLLNRDKPLDCLNPLAKVSEENSRVQELRVECDHRRMRHYQDTGFKDPETRQERIDSFWANLEIRYHYCIDCRRFTNECRLARNSACLTEHTSEPLDDTDFVRLAWVASQVQAIMP